MADTLRFLSICGMLGYGYPEESLRAGVEWGPAFLGADNGSTDPGPYYLGTGTSFLKPLQLKRDLELALVAARQVGVPLIVGSAGGAGARPHVDSLLEILYEIAGRRSLRFSLAVIHADVAPDIVLQAMRDGRISPCGPAGQLTEAKVQGCSHMVAQMGTTPIIEALRGGADVVVAGRCCDTAIFAAMPILHGFDPALALHAAKIAECGTLCAVPGGANDALLCKLAEDHFCVEPANRDKRCTPESVAAHSLYEQPAPDRFFEPEGMVDLSSCRFQPSGDRGVRVDGTRLVSPLKSTVKLEGALLRGFRSIAVAGTCDPGVISHLDEIESAVVEVVGSTLEHELAGGGWKLRFLRYGLGAVAAPGPMSTGGLPSEIGLVIEAIAPSQELADAVLSLARSTALHQPFGGRKTTAGNFAFPFSPSDFSGGGVYEFALYHLMEVEDENSLFPIRFEEV